MSLIVRTYYISLAQKAGSSIEYFSDSDSDDDYFKKRSRGDPEAIDSDSDSQAGHL